MKLEGSDTSHAHSCAAFMSWSTSAKSYIVTFCGTQRFDETHRLGLDRLNTIIPDTLCTDSASAAGLEGIIQARPSDAQVRTLIAYQKSVDAYEISMAGELVGKSVQCFDSYRGDLFL